CASESTSEFKRLATNYNTVRVKKEFGVALCRQKQETRYRSHLYNMRMKILKTDRLFLRTWGEDDFELARSLWGDPDVMTFLGGPLADEKVLEKMRAEIACFAKHGVQYWPVFETQTNDFAGCCGLRPWAYQPPGGHEIGFHFAKPKWGRGYACE